MNKLNLENKWKIVAFSWLSPLLYPPVGAWAAESQVPELSIPVLKEVTVSSSPIAYPLEVLIDTRDTQGPLRSTDGASFLTQIPGFSMIRKGGSNGEAVLRGMGGSRLGILVDGQELYGSCYSRMDSPASYVYPDLYEEVLVRKGPQNVVAGAGLSAGVVDFRRKKPVFTEPDVHLRSQFLAGRFGRNDQMAEIETGAQSWYGRVSATRSESHDYRDGDGNTVHSAYERWGTNAALGWTPDIDTLVEFSGGVSDGRAAYADRHSDATMLKRTNWQLRMEKMNISPWVRKLDFSMGYSHADHVMDNYSRRTIDPSWNGILMVMNPRNRVRSGKLSLTLTPARNVEWVLGVDRQHMQAYNRMAMYYPFYENLPGLPPELYYNNTTDYHRMPLQQYSDIEKRGVFTEISVGLNADNSSRLVGGVRVDRQNAEFPSVLKSRKKSLRSGFLRYEQDLPLLGGTAYAGIGHSERFPDYWEFIWVNDAVGGADIADLKPEALTQVDIGMSWDTGEWSGSISGFYGKTRDYLLFHWRPAIFVENIDSRSFGLEATSTWQVAPHWSVGANVAWVRGFNETFNRPLPQQPPLEGTLSVNYSMDAVSVGGALRIVAPQRHIDYGTGGVDGFDREQTPGFATLALNASWKPVKGMTLSAGIDNLFDRQYAEHLSNGYSPGTPSSLIEPLGRIYEPGRVFWAGLAYQF